MSIKRFNEMNKIQQDLYTGLADVIEAWANKHDLNKPEGVRQIFDVLVTLTLALKALYLMKKEKTNDIQSSSGTRNTEVPTGTDQPPTGNH